jgi:hypothetical protein
MARFSSYDALEITELTNSHKVIGTPVPLPPFAPISRSNDETVPVYGASLGLSYEVSAFKVGAGYRWERYVNAIDGGFQEHKSEDRTMDGPYFKIAVGFGG